MFKCENEFCGKVVQSGQPVNRIVTERRPIVYEKEITRYGKVIDVEEVKGWEIVKEIRVCPKCFSTLTGQKPTMVSSNKKPPPRKHAGFNSRPPRKKKWQNPGAQSKRRTETQSNDATKQHTESKKKPIVEKVNPLPIIK